MSWLRLFLCTLALLGATGAFANQQAEALRTKGLQAIHADQWADAIAHLDSAWTLEHHSLTAYLLAVSHSKLRDVEETLVFSQRALKGTPRLAASYRTGAETLLGWAHAVLVQSGKYTYLMQRKYPPGSQRGAASTRRPDAPIRAEAVRPEIARAETERLANVPAARDARIRIERMIEANDAACGQGPEAAACRMRLSTPDAPDAPVPK